MSDIAAAYPTNQCVFNVSRSTTLSELIDIVGVHPSVYRMENLNLLSGKVNATEYCRIMFNFPALHELSVLVSNSMLEGDVPC